MRQWIVTFGWTGRSPYAPGTAASLASTLAVYALYMTLLSMGAGTLNFFFWQAVLIMGVIAFSAMSVGFGPWASTFYGRKDPPAFVLDEVAGICLTWLFQPMFTDWRQAWVALWTFVAFRIFDVWKPPPARQLEKLPAGWGVLMDDLAAAVYANLLCQVMLRWVVPLGSVPA